VSHGGGDTGFRSFFLLIPERNISIQLASNYELTRPADIAYAVLDLITGETPDTIKRQIGFHFAEVLMQQGLAKAKDFFHKTNADSLERKNYFWKEDEAAFTYAGYLLLDQGMFPEAEHVLKFNLEQFPSSGYAYGALGTAYARMKKNDLAKLNLRKALERVPGDEDFRAELEKLEGKPKASLK
jgi:tetratricopeptide (TPR) repeat protein